MLPVMLPLIVCPFTVEAAVAVRLGVTSTSYFASAGVLIAVPPALITVFAVLVVVAVVLSAALTETAEAATGATANKAAAAALTILKFFFMWSFPP